MKDDYMDHNEHKVLKKKDVNSHLGEIFKLSDDGVMPHIDYNETFKSAFDFSGIGMMVVAPEGKILETNNAVSSFLGFTKQELLQLNFLDLGHPDDNVTDSSLMDNMLSKLLNYYSLEKRYISKYNKILWGLHTVSKVLNKDGTLKFYVLQIVDITRKKELTDELSRKNSELEAIRTGLINKLNQLEELNNIIAHNLRGPANNIKLLIDMLRNKDKQVKEPGLELEVNEIVEFLTDSSTSLSSTLDTLMDVGISMRKGIPSEDCNVHDIIKEILAQLNATIYEKKAEVNLSLVIQQISYPRVFLESILYNLLSNALKYTAKDRKPEITISTYTADDRVVISVKDNGLGLNLHKYGNKLFKLNQVFHPGHDSKGVGLFITKTQIESFGGSIKVKSEENKGAEFIVTL